jgi:hypothetical protein
MHLGTWLRIVTPPRNGKVRRDTLRRLDEHSTSEHASRLIPRRKRKLFASLLRILADT